MAVVVSVRFLSAKRFRHKVVSVGHMVVVIDVSRRAAAVVRIRKMGTSVGIMRRESVRKYPLFFL
ncbi:uncharacterized protein PHALS_14518 [Plasmopara halstedii]|uniref:Uncharacterized protein n=1 Tax=Plasmopara halstedii TaxID=4781 RepID=A0A0N7L5E8_PLAHL|nr:uncharacterized protein PHALS_14518 [Plasmopara halstedii]CEG41275.1 hypothetical protein PHALS_14518 [Plasmopara halstedii]|eukprot:XP_024577644.1 hypothetical protein PHALS_14518 [Plasmopara halstedii]